MLGLLVLLFLPGFSCYELGPEPEMGPTLQAGYLPVVSVHNDFDDLKNGTGFTLGGGVGTTRGGEVVRPEEFKDLVDSEEELTQWLQRYPRGYQIHGSFQDWAARDLLTETGIAGPSR